MRYFIIFYHGMYSSRSADLSQYIFGDKGIKTKQYPNKKAIEKEIKEDYGLEYVHVTNIQEVAKEEFESYYR